MQAFRDQIAEQQRAAGVRVIKPPHALGFLDPNLPLRTPPSSVLPGANLSRRAIRAHLLTRKPSPGSSDFET